MCAVLSLAFLVRAQTADGKKVSEAKAAVSFMNFLLFIQIGCSLIL
jgi:hypothetical protein